MSIYVMGEKTHQTDKREYQIRVDGKPVCFPIFVMCQETIDIYLKICAENPGCYVDIVEVSTHIILNQQIYGQMQKHFVPE